MHSAGGSPRLNVDEIRIHAKGRWREILGGLGLDLPNTATKHGPCPVCGGKDRFRFDDKDGSGSWYCNQCKPKAGDGFALIRNVFSCDFAHALETVAREIGYRPLNGRNDRQLTESSDDLATSMPKGELGRDLFVYENAEGVPVIYVQRRNRSDGEKTFRQCGWTADGRGWQRNLHHAPKPRPLYRLRAILSSVQRLTVFHEGEKATEAALKAGLPGVHTTTLGGAKNPKHTDFSPMKGRDVVICRDNDTDGEYYAKEVARLCHEAGATSVKVLLLPGLPVKGDVVEWLQAGETVEAFAGLLAQAEPVEVANAQAGPLATSRAIFRRASDIQAKPIHWLWKGRFARGKVSMIAGNPGLGKSQVTASIAAKVSTGGVWPVDGALCELGNVVILNAEDNPEDTLRPRLEAAGANLSRVFILDAVTDGTVTNGSENRRGFNLKVDLSRLGEMLEEIGGAALIIIDPITAYLGTTDSHKNAEIRALLSPLAGLAANHEAAVVCVSHFNKNSSGEALMRVTGSLAFVAAARAAFVVTKDLEQDVRRLFLPLKNNLGNDQTGLAFTVESVQLESLQGPIETSRVLWQPGAVTTTAQEAMAPQEIGEERGDLDDAKDFLRNLLAEGPVPTKQIQKDAEGAGYAWRTIQRAKKLLGVTAKKEGMKEGWSWRLDGYSRSEERHNTPKSATPGEWLSSYSSAPVGGLRSDDRRPIQELSAAFNPELPLMPDEMEEVVDL